MLFPGTARHSERLRTDDLKITWSISKLNTQVNPTICLGDTHCWIQKVTAPTLVVTCWIHQSASILPSTCTRGSKPPLSCNGKHIQFISIECNLMLHVISEASVMTCSSHDSRDMSSIRLIFKGSPIPYSQTFI